MTLSKAQIPDLRWPDLPRDLQEMVGATIYAEIDTFTKNTFLSESAGLSQHGERMSGMRWAFYSALSELGLPVPSGIISNAWELVPEERKGWVWYLLLHEISDLVKASEFCRAPLVKIEVTAARITLAAAAHRAAAVALGYGPGIL